MKELADGLRSVLAGKRYAAAMRKVGAEIAAQIGEVDLDPLRPDDVSEIIGYQPRRFMRTIEDFILKAGEEELDRIEKFVKIRRKQL